MWFLTKIVSATAWSITNSGSLIRQFKTILNGNSEKCFCLQVTHLCFRMWLCFHGVVNVSRYKFHHLWTPYSSWTSSHYVPRQSYPRLCNWLWHDIFPQLITARPINLLTFSSLMSHCLTIIEGHRSYHSCPMNHTSTMCLSLCLWKQHGNCFQRIWF